MFCSQCGQQIDDDSRFCRHCGASQKNQPPERESLAVAPGGEEVADPEAVINTSVSPSKLPGRLLGGGVVIVLLLIFVGSLQAPPGDQDTELPDLENSTSSAVSNSTPGSEVATPPPVAANWSYSTDEDKVRGRTAYFASTTSTNSVYQDSPYESATKMYMTVRKHPAYGTDVILTVSSGQMMCPSYSGCSGTVRFDDGPAQRVNFNGPEDNDSETVFVEGSSSFISKLKKADKVVIEKTLYQAGNPQFEFDVHGLKWDH